MKVQILLAGAILALCFQGSAGAIERGGEQVGGGSGCGTPPVETLQTAEIVSSAPRPASAPAPADEGGATAGNAAAVVPQVELYVTSWCPYCKQAENFFRSQGIPFTAYDIEKDSSAARRKEELDSSTGVPLAIINGQKIHGFSESLYREALKKKP